MQKRIDDFIKVATERNADAHMYQLYQKLLGLCAEDDRKKLNAAWNEVANERDLSKWDEAFLEETINPSNEKPVDITAPQITGNMHLGILAGGGAGQMNAGLAQHYHSTTAAQQQAQAVNMQAQIANQHMNEYYHEMHKQSLAAEKTSYFDQVKSAIGL